MKLFTVKAVAVLAAGAAGGIAVAASAGTLPNPLARPPGTGDSRPPGPPARVQPGQPVDSGARTGTTPTRPVPGGSGGTPSTPATAAAPPPAVVGLCRAYLARRGANRAKALDTPAFAALVTAAGGRGNVTAYCVRLLVDARPDPPGSGPDDGKKKEKKEKKRSGRRDDDWREDAGRRHDPDRRRPRDDRRGHQETP